MKRILDFATKAAVGIEGAIILAIVIIAVKLVFF